MARWVRCCSVERALDGAVDAHEAVAEVPHRDLHDLVRSVGVEPIRCWRRRCRRRRTCQDERPSHRERLAADRVVVVEAGACPMRAELREAERLVAGEDDVISADGTAPLVLVRARRPAAVFVVQPVVSQDRLPVQVEGKLHLLVAWSADQPAEAGVPATMPQRQTRTRTNQAALMDAPSCWPARRENRRRQRIASRRHSHRRRCFWAGSACSHRHSRPFSSSPRDEVYCCRYCRRCGHRRVH